MALGEAFVNVHADLKPFAKDLEKGIKAILRSAEKQIRSDNNLGKALAANLNEGLKTGISTSVDEGLDEGTKKGTRKALTGFAKFFATLGDFADDGLSALPSEVKAALVLGVVGAAAAIAPLLSGAVTSAITAGAGIAIAGIGIALASRFKVVENQFTAVGRTLLDQLTASSRFFVAPLIEAGADIVAAFNEVGDEIDRIFSQAALNVKPLTAALTGFVKNLLPGIQSAVEKARPLIDVLSEAIPQLGADIGSALDVLADGSDKSAVALDDLIRAIGDLIIFTAGVVRVLSDLYFYLRLTAALMSGEWIAAVDLLTRQEYNATRASGQLTGAQGDLDTALGRSAAEAKAAALAISDLVTEQLRGVDATLDYEQAIDDLQKSIREGNRDFRETEENGRRNLRLVEAAITGAARQRDADIARALQNGESTAQIEANYLREIAALEKVIGKDVKQQDALKELFRIAREGPKEVNIAVTTPGLAEATQRWRNFGSAVRGAISALLAAGAHNIQGLQTTTQKKYAGGGIVSAPTNALIAEAGYAEAVIPDPRVKPGRALQLADQFGLTSLIADTLRGGAQVINVFVGNEKLAQYVDYRVGYGNALNATAIAQGPRGI